MDTLARSRGVQFSYDAESGEILALGEPLVGELLDEVLDALAVDFETYRQLLSAEGKHFLSRIRTAG